MHNTRRLKALLSIRYENPGFSQLTVFFNAHNMAIQQAVELESTSAFRGTGNIHERLDKPMMYISGVWKGSHEVDIVNHDFRQDLRCMEILSLSSVSGTHIGTHS